MDTAAVSRVIGGAVSAMAANGPKSTSAAIARVTRLGMTPRQIRLNYLWSWYTGHQYAHRKHAWDGTKHLDILDAQAVAESGMGGSLGRTTALPLRYRRPSVPYRLATVIVDRFTALLFSAQRHPDLRVQGDEATEDYAQAMAETARLWPAFVQARTYGGATGSACLSFKFRSGKPIVENHDPRWCTVEFTDRESGTVKKLTKLYMNSRDELTARGWVTEWYWHKREITDTSDTLYKPLKVDQGGKEPVFEIEAQSDHGFGFCPVVWVQNEPDQYNLDGVSDIACVLELIEGIDQLTSQAHRGILANCDPTLVLSTNAEFTAIKKGSDNALKLPEGSSANYLEISGTGPARALEMAADLRRSVLEVAQVVLENVSTVAQTATEIERSYASMLARADILREQYGERGVLPLVNMMLKAARLIESGDITNADGEAMAIDLPPRLVPAQTPDGEPTLEPRLLGDATDYGDRVTLQWGPYLDRTVDEALKAVQTAGAAKAASLIDPKTASNYVARYFDVEDVAAMLKGIEDEQAAAMAAMAGGLGPVDDADDVYEEPAE